MHRFILLAVLLAAAAATACTEAVFCTDSVEPGLIVEIRDSVDDTPLAAGASGSVRLRSPLVWLTCAAALPSLGPAFLQSQTPSAPAAATRSELDSIVRTATADLPLASASVAALQGDDTLIFVSHGYADLENRVRAGPETVYRIGSITKQFTAAAILQQVERGAIGLDQSARRYLPELPSAWKRVTIRQLLNHTSGLKDFGDLGDRFLAVRSTDLPQRDVLALIARIAFEAEPGTRWRYSNAGYYLLGVILERVTGRPYLEYLEERVWTAAGLAGTGGCEPRAIVPHRARGYEAIGTEFLNVPQVSLSIPFSSEGLCSTARDLATWARALRSGRVISQASYRLMTTPYGAAAKADPPYGFAVWVIQAEGRRYISHLGLFEGFNGVLSDVPSDSLTIAVLTNTSGFGASTLGGRLGAAILGIRAPPIPKAIALDQPRIQALTKTERERYTGRYALRLAFNADTLGGSVTLDVFDENGRLTAQLRGDPPEILARVKDHEFVAVGRPDMRFIFEVREGRGIRVSVRSPVVQAEGSRIDR
jgi:D-alanyl-D-alanine carboxypeptidase